MNGGPDGGDGGSGGDVIIVGDNQVRTLVDLRYRQYHEAENGTDGSSQKRTGKRGADAVVRVPLGTMVFADDKLIADIKSNGERRVILRGGRGGHGNARFATATRQAPDFAKPGEKAVQRELVLELKLIADVGLIGFPNAGKSTLLSVVSAAKPKIANYPFTTLEPNIGMVRTDNGDFVLADLPGLIEGAADGAGLGHTFLRHAERTRLLIHVIDGSGQEDRDPVSDYQIIQNELKAYGEKFGAGIFAKPQLIAINKADLPETDENAARVKEAAGDVPVFVISAAAQKGVRELINRAAAMLRELPEPAAELESSIELESIEPLTGFGVKKEEGEFFAYGPGMRRLIDSTNFSDRDSVAWFHKQLINIGVIAALRDIGASQGDTVYVEDMPFDFVD
jgi:GTP-binding protein